MNFMYKSFILVIVDVAVIAFISPNKVCRANKTSDVCLHSGATIVHEDRCGHVWTADSVLISPQLHVQWENLSPTPCRVGRSLPNSMSCGKISSQHMSSGKSCLHRSNNQPTIHNAAFCPSFIEFPTGRISTFSQWMETQPLLRR